MKQFILESEPDKENNVRLEGGDYHYLVRVRRLAVGEFFPALLPNGEETSIQILSIENNILTGKCTIPQKNTGLNLKSNTLPPIILFQAMPKSDKMDLIVRQAAEGGITEIVPFLSEFSFAKAVSSEKQKFIRWERIIKEARQQSGSKITTLLKPTLTMNELFEYWHKIKSSGSLGLLFHHTPAKGLEQNSLHGYLNNNPDVVALVIGPEGGFSEKEATFFLKNDFRLITVGDTVLRTETAALYCSAAIRILLLERDSWEKK